MKEQYISTSYGPIHIYQKGTGPKPIVLLHGAGCDNAMLSWREVMEAFPSEHYTVYAPDQLGYGLSAKPDGLFGDDFYPTHIACLKEIVDYLGLDTFALAGLSMGGAISIGFALAYPDRVPNLFLVGSWGLSARFPYQQAANWYIYQTNATLHQYKWLVKHRRLVPLFLRYSLIGNKKHISPDLIEEVIQSCNRDGAGKSMQDFQRSSCTTTGSIPYYGQQLRQLKMPVVFFAGERDPLVPLKNIKAALRLVPNAKLYIFPRCKHWSVKERPQAFVKLLQQYYN